jgi:hypothetical protein
MTLPSPALPSPLHYVFVDFENVHQVDPSVFGTKSFHFTLLLGAAQKKLNVELVEKLMEHAASVQLVRLNFSGKNALDFTLAYYLGRSVMTDPTGCFHIVSKDTGFKPLIEHLLTRRIRAQRHDDFSTLTASAVAKPPSVPLDDLFSRVLEHLRKHGTNRPKRKKTLISHLLALCGKNATETDVLDLIEKLRQAGHLSIGEKDAVTYADLDRDIEKS